MAIEKNIVVVTGANSGLGLELVSQLLADQHKHVLLGSRSVEKGQAALKEVQSSNKPGSVELLEIDVTSESSIAAAVKTVESKHGRLDTLVNNAGVAFGAGEVAQQFLDCYKTNVIGTQLTTDAFVPLLKKSKSPRIVNVSSAMGSMTCRLDPSYPGHDLKYPQYRASKSALNMVTACQAVDFGGDGFKVFAYCPGFCESNLGPYNKAEYGAKPTSEGVTPLIPIIDGKRDAEHGGFLHEKGQYQW